MVRPSIGVRAGATKVATLIAGGKTMQTETHKKYYEQPSLIVYGSVQAITREATQNFTVFDADFPAGTSKGDLTFYS